MQFRFIVIILLFTQLAKSQNVTILDNVLAISSREEFVVNNLYKIASNHFSDDDQIDLHISGDLSSFNFSLAIVTMLPSFENFPKTKSLNITYHNLNSENFDEAMLIEFVKSKHPSLYLEYLLFRAECLFIDSSKVFFELHSINQSDFLTFSAGKKNQKIVLNKFSARLTLDYRVLVNGVDFVLIPQFYDEYLDLSQEINLSSNYEWNHLYFLSEVIYNSIGRGVIEGTIPKNAFYNNEFASSQNDLYATLVMCITDKRLSMISVFNYFNPSKKYTNMMENCGCETLVKYFNVDFQNSLVKNNIKYKRTETR